MNTYLRELAGEIFASPMIQQICMSRLYNPDHIAKQALIAAQAFLDVISEISMDEITAKVTLSAYISRLQNNIIGGDRGLFINEATEASKVAEILNREFQLIANAELPSEPKAKAENEGTDGQGDKTPEPIVVDVPVEDLHLPKNVVEMLVAAKLVTAKGILAGDAEGKVEGINGVGPQLRTKIVAAAEKALKTPAPVPTKSGEIDGDTPKSGSTAS